MTPKGIITIRTCSLVEVGVVLLEEACHCWGQVLRALSQASLRVVVSQLPLLLSQDAVLSDTPAPCVPACCLAPHRDDNELNL